MEVCLRKHYDMLLKSKAEDLAREEEKSRGRLVIYVTASGNLPDPAEPLLGRFKVYFSYIFEYIIKVFNI